MLYRSGIYFGDPPGGLGKYRSLPGLALSEALQEDFPLSWCKGGGEFSDVPGLGFRVQGLGFRAW